MTVVFADTWYFLALVNPSDAGHPRAVAYTKTLSAGLVTTTWVLTEMADALAATAQGRAEFVATRDDLCADPNAPLCNAFVGRPFQADVCRPDSLNLGCPGQAGKPDLRMRCKAQSETFLQRIAIPCRNGSRSTVSLWKWALFEIQARLRQIHCTRLV